MLLAEAARSLARHADAQRLYAGMLERDPALVSALWGSFLTSLAQGDHAAAQSMVVRMRRTHPDSALADAAQGQLAVARGEHAAAVGAFRAAHARAPSSQSSLMLAGALVRSGALDAARGLLTDWLANNPADPAARRELGNLELAAGRLPDAREHFESLLRQSPDDAIALNNLAWLYDLAGDERALAHAEHAHRLSPDSIEAKDTLGWILVRQGSLRRGLRLLEQAHRRQTGDPVIAHHYAHALVAAGEKPRAREILAHALEVHADFHDRDAAERMLRTLATEG
jgi:predicted Zn-dependent protease